MMENGIPSMPKNVRVIEYNLLFETIYESKKAPSSRVRTLIDKRNKQAL